MCLNYEYRLYAQTVTQFVAQLILASIVVIPGAILSAAQDILHIST